MKELLPSHFTSFPCHSIFQKSEAETICLNIIIILKRTGNTWRRLPWTEYKKERKKDGNFTVSEKEYFKNVVKYTKSPIDASNFCSDWDKIFKKSLKSK